MDTNKSTELFNFDNMTHDDLVEIVKKSLRAQKWLKLQMRDLKNEKDQILNQLAESTNGQSDSERNYKESSSNESFGFNSDTECEHDAHVCCPCYFELLQRYVHLYEFAETEIHNLEQGEYDMMTTLKDIISLQNQHLLRLSGGLQSCNQSVNETDAYSILMREKTLLEEELQFVKQESANKDLRRLELDDYRTFARDLEEHARTLRIQIENQTQSFTELSEKHQSLCDEKEKLAIELSEAQLLNKEMNMDTEVLNQTVLTLKLELKDAQSKFNDSSEMVDQLATEIANLKLQLEDGEIEKNKKFLNLQTKLQSKCEEIEKAEKLLKLQIDQQRTIQEELDYERHQHSIYRIKVNEALRKKECNGDERKLLALQSEKFRAVNEECLNFKNKVEKCESINNELMMKINEQATSLQRYEAELSNTIEELTCTKRHHLEEIQNLKLSHNQVVEKMKEDLHQFNHLNTQLREMNKELIDSSKKSVSELILKEQEISSLKNEIYLAKIKADDFELKADRLHNVVKVLQQSAAQNSMQSVKNSIDINNKFTYGDLNSILKTDYDILPISKVLFHESHQSDDFREVQVENMRLKEMAAALKLEIRRLEEKGAWQKHIPNTEYLKTALLKMFSSNNNDEKLVLVKVISKILLLSEEECNSLKRFISTSYFW